jgi:hypothetical protein
MYLSLNRLGSLFLETAGDRLDAKFIRDTGMLEDYFTMEKGPRIRIARMANQAVLSWSASASQFQLQTCTSLSNPIWTNANQTPILVGDQLAITNNVNDHARFYRLMRP